MENNNSTSIEQRLENIEQRNKQVEIDKAWETSKTRKLLITIFTYLIIALYLRAIEVDRPWINAIVPTIGFLLSTLTMPWFKRVWIKRNSNAN